MMAFRRDLALIVRGYRIILSIDGTLIPLKKDPYRMG